MVRQFADEQIIPNAEHYDGDGRVPGADRRADQGARASSGSRSPRSTAGLGLDLTTYVMVVEELSRGWISISGVINTHFIGSYLLLKYGSDEQKQKYLPRMATGEIRAAFSLSEPELGSDVQAIKTLGQEGRRRRLRDQRPEDVGHQRPDVRLVFLLVKTDPDAAAAPQGLHLLHHREGAGRRREHRRVRRPHRPAQDQEDGLQGRRVHRAGLRRLQVPGREHPRRRGGRPQQGLRADDGRARGRPRQRRRPRRRPRPARAGARACATPRSARRSASRSPSTRRSSSSSPTWPPSSTRPAC